MANRLPSAGLEDVVALGSSICHIDGTAGRLAYRGYDIHDLAEHATYEEVVYLLWHGDLPAVSELADHRSRLARHMVLPEPVIALMRQLPTGVHPMCALRTAVSALASYSNLTVESEEDRFEQAAQLVAQIPIIVAAFDRLRRGEPVLEPDPELSIAANFLYMLTGKAPDQELARMFDMCLTLHADHELNASTFAARVTAATLADMYSAVVAAIAALKGPLHGGANEQVMAMLLEIGDPAKADEYVAAALAGKRKIMGFGHRVYKTEDPRVPHLRALAQRMAERTKEYRWYAISLAVEKAVRRRKPLPPNVDFFSASTYYLMGIPTDMYTAVFAMGRIAGWTAHILEQYANNRLIRPRAEYIGPRERAYQPLAGRAG